jgi:hypothetical protein
VDLPGDFFDNPDEEEESASPWADSVPGTAYDRAMQEGPATAAGGAEGAEDREDGEDAEDEDDEEEDDPGQERQAAVFLGQIIRFDHDRKHPGDLALETMDVLRTIVQGDVSEVVDKVLEDLLGEAGPPS